PDLLAVHHIMATVANRARLEAGKVRAGTRLRVALAPPRVVPDDVSQMLLPLFRRAEGVDHRPGHGRAEGHEGGAPARPSSSWKAKKCSGDQPRPPCSVGHFPVSQPRAPSRLSQASYSLFSRCWPRACLRRTSGGISRSQKARTSARKASSSLLCWTARMNMGAGALVLTFAISIAGRAARLRHG